MAAFAARNPTTVTVSSVAPSPHALEWNSDPGAFSHDLTDWIGTLRGFQ